MPSSAPVRNVRKRGSNGSSALLNWSGPGAKSSDTVCEAVSLPETLQDVGRSGGERHEFATIISNKRFLGLSETSVSADEDNMGLPMASMRGTLTSMRKTVPRPYAQQHACHCSRVGPNSASTGSWEKKMPVVADTEC